MHASHIYVPLAQDLCLVPLNSINLQSFYVILYTLHRTRYIDRHSSLAVALCSTNLTLNSPLANGLTNIRHVRNQYSTV
jgi:hypothetical protein